ncbi:MAG: Gfo/Idh/MocA family oxidoreductase [Chloroflexota bacterium]
MTTYRGGLVGCGRIGTLWETDPPTPLTHAGAMAVHPHIDLVTGSSRGEEHLQWFGSRWDIDALYLDYREMFEQEQLDIVCIATHPGLHLPIVEAAVAVGAKGILCEKPLALSLADGDAIVEACKRTGCVLSVNHSRRWDPAHRKAKAMVEQGQIGEIVSLLGICQGIKPFPAWVADEEGPLIHDAVHTFDLFRMFGGDVASVVGTAQRRVQPFQVEDISDAIFTFQNGINGVAMSSEITRYNRFELEIQGTDGLIVLGNLGNRWCSSVDQTDHLNEPDPRIEWYSLTPEPFPEVTEASSIATAMAELVDCIETGATPSSTGEDGVASLEMVMGIYESQLQGNVPVAFPLQQRDSALYRLREAGQFS